MEQFAYSFAITLLHSVWQMSLLLLLYVCLTKMMIQWPPLAKRNLLFLLLGAQVLSSAVSFILVYSEPFHDYRENIQSALNSLVSSETWLRSYAETIFWMYALMVFYKLISSLIHWMNFSRGYKTNLVKPSIDLRLFTQAKAYHFGINRKVAIWFSETIHSPMTFGFWKPVILLPVALVNQLSVEQTESLVIHELTHIKSNDYLLNWFLVSIESIYFFNPFVKIVAQKIRMEREKNCDVQVLQFDYPAIGYAETLLHTARQQRLSYSLQLSAVHNQEDLFKRIQYFTDNRNIDNQSNRRFPLAFFGIAVFVMCNLFFASYFLKNDVPVSDIAANTAFVALPVNEWNKSITNGPFTNTLTAAANHPAPANNQAPTGKKPSKKIRSAIEPEMVFEQPEPSVYTPVAFAEPTETKSEIVIKEEISSGKIITKFYQVKTLNGEVVLEPLWMTAEIKPLIIDSLHQKIKADSTGMLKLVPTFQ